MLTRSDDSFLPNPSGSCPLTPLSRTNNLAETFPSSSPAFSTQSLEQQNQQLKRCESNSFIPVAVEKRKRKRPVVGDDYTTTEFPVDCKRPRHHHAHDQRSQLSTQKHKQKRALGIQAAASAAKSPLSDRKVRHWFAEGFTVKEDVESLSKGCGYNNSSEGLGNGYNTAGNNSPEQIDEDYLDTIETVRSGSLPLTKAVLYEFNSCDLGPRVSPTFMDDESISSDPSQQAKSKASTIKATDELFETGLRDRGAFFADSSTQLPSNYEAFRNVLYNERASPGPTTKATEDFLQLAGKVRNETSVFLYLAGDIMPCIREALLSNNREDAIPNQPWKACLDPDPGYKPPLAVPKPDQTLGWGFNAFNDCPRVNTSELRHIIHPVAGYEDLHWPFCTVEAKGEQGVRRIARRQNLHNCAVMLHNMLALERRVDRTDSFFQQNPCVLSRDECRHSPDFRVLGCG